MQYIQKHTKHLILITSLVILSLFAVFFCRAQQEAEHSLLLENLAKTKSMIKVICKTIDDLVAANDDWATGRHQETVIALTTNLDNEKNIYAELFDEHYQRVSNRIVHDDDDWSGEAFDPTAHDDIKELFDSTEQGEVIIKNSDPHDPFDIYLIWRWIPTDTTQQNRLLQVVGISQHSVETKLPDRIVDGIAALFIFSAVVIVGYAIGLKADR